MPVIIPTRTDSATYFFSVELEGVVFVFRFQFNERDQSWFFDLLDADGVAIRQGVKCVTNYPLLRLVADPERPAGELYCIDTTGEDRRAGLADLGDALDFVYFDSSELPSDLFAGL